VKQRQLQHFLAKGLKSNHHLWSDCPYKGEGGLQSNCLVLNYSSMEDEESIFAIMAINIIFSISKLQN
jgi:hypothetical protein